MPGSNEYLFEFTVSAALRIRGATEDEAQAKLAELLDCADVHFGQIDGEPVVGEVSLCSEPTLAEVNGEAV